ncbi:BDH_1b_G0000010.mRNA.1.CDS.1 [Saccharomyces cerevisiae]|nr:BDH_1b_G0000010.mRNA.1.CDS.1 [Saccharomyces cerevisiae]CAI7032801.1 BDH_1b_G0000010.mRNA.1.CDS.1 [Saccharomyces cerevisiae]
MYAGYYYPLKVVYSNAVSWGTLPISVELPDGTTVSDDFEGQIVLSLILQNILLASSQLLPNCGLVLFTSTSTEVTTVTGTNGQPTNETVIVAKTPTTATSFSLSSSSSEQITISITS